MKKNSSRVKSSGKRLAEFERNTKETSISVAMNLDGKGHSDIKTQVPFFTHMLELFSKHSLIDLKVAAKGDIEVDGHHSVEDIGIVMGMVFAKALGDKRHIKRYGNSFAPMDETLSLAAIDICNRPHLVFDVKVKKVKTGTFDAELVKEFFQAFVANARIALHIKCFYGDNTHHIFESVFKAFALAVRDAVSLDMRVEGLPTTKDFF